LLESETEEEFEQKDRIWPLLKKWITPEVADLERTAIYTFKSMVASSWKKGRLFIAGDAAHLMPPFMGQGMCAGIRDAANLAWKIAAVIKKQSDKDLLDSYESERAPHVNSYIQTAIRLGSLINTTDPKKAFEVSSDNNRREAKMKSLYPVLGLGLGSNFSDSLKKHRGTIAGQPVLSNSHLLDDFCGYNTLCISREEIKGSSGKIDNLPFLCLDAQEEPILNEFLNELEVEAVIIRPDRYVLASARNENEIKKLLTIRL
jgi:3-(3-hydroxy-phenyl)propionate hydroxylase